VSDRLALGAAGEAHARRWLEARGYRFVVANWRCQAGELDLVMADGPELVVVEVKLRRGEGSGRAEEAVTPVKARKLLRATAWFVANHPEWHDAVWRIDLLAITLDASGRVARVGHAENAVVAG
jgi:putative endonuclease